MPKNKIISTYSIESFIYKGEQKPQSKTVSFTINIKNN